MINKINVYSIIRDNFRTLVHDSDGTRSDWDIALFVVVPLIASTALLSLKGVFGQTTSGVLVTAYSIFAALLFNLLLLVYDIVKKSNNARSVKSRFLKQVYSNISYSVFVSILLIAILLAYFVAMSTPRLVYLKYALAFLVYALTANFLLTMLMILRRVHILLSKEFEEPNIPSAE
ncbi:MAG TPA: hypothetical protein VEW46_18610 [Pyrinomonadaceae bacterium]|nr:hypothetical protein [Pyrinomonadaceae bacterium]